MEFINRISEADNLSQIVTELSLNVEGDLDLGVLFVCPWPPFEPEELTQALKAKLNIRHMICCTCAGIVGSDREIEGRPAASLILMRLPGVKLVQQIKQMDASQLQAPKPKISEAGTLSE